MIEASRERNPMNNDDASDHAVDTKNENSINLSNFQSRNDEEGTLKQRIGHENRTVPCSKIKTVE